MKISALASGSSGNCFFIGNDKTNSAILVDAGISCKRIVESLMHLKQDPENIKAIFVTHEHTDHTRGVDVLARKFNLPIFATKGTIDNSFLCAEESLINKIKNNETIRFAGMEIEAFSKSHDVRDPISFKIRQKQNGKSISVMTDIGHACGNVIESVNDSNFLIMEANHNIKMLREGPYPYFLKRRIESPEGHISNLNSALCVLEHARSKLKNIMLAHLSEVNNTPLVALQTYQDIIKERSDLHPRISVSLRDTPTHLFKI